MEAPNQVESLTVLPRFNARWNEKERIAILRETDRVLADPAFRGSKRCQALLRRLVEHAVSNEHDRLKERTLGIEVFGRDPNYDTATDPVVRTAANEIRKRLAQSYQNANSPHGISIRLKPGAYLPEFDFVHEQVQPEAEQSKSVEGDVAAPKLDALPAVNEPAARPAAPSRLRAMWLSVAAIFSILLIIFAIVHVISVRSKDYLMWKPLLDPSQPLIMCISDSVVDAKEISEGKPDPNTSMTDAEDAQKITTWLMAHGRQTSLRGSSTVNFRDLSQGPVVLIGAFNPWSHMLLSNLRYSAHNDPATHTSWIQDAHEPSSREWMINTDHVDTDYAIITRSFDLQTGKWILGLGGLRPFGTQAAGDFLTDRSLTNLLPDDLGSKGNFQIVLKTSIIDGSAGRPEVIAFYTW